MTEGTKSPIQVGTSQVKSGLPPRLSKSYGSKYDSILDQAQSLAEFDDYVEVPANGDGKRLLSAIRTTIKRRAKDSGLGARLHGDAVLVFRKPGETTSN